VNPTNILLTHLVDIAPQFEAGRTAHPNIWLMIAAGNRESCPPLPLFFMRAHSPVWRRWESRAEAVEKRRRLLAAWSPALRPQPEGNDAGPRPIPLRRREEAATSHTPGHPTSCDETAYFFGYTGDIEAFVVVAEYAGSLLDSTAPCPPVNSFPTGAVCNSAPLALWIGRVYATLREHRHSLILRPPATPDGIELYVLDLNPWEASLLTIRLLQAEQAPALSAVGAQPAEAEAEARPASLVKESEDRMSSTNETGLPLPDADAIAAAANRRRKTRARLDEIDANREKALHNANALLTACQRALPHATDYDKNPVIPPERRPAVADALLALWAGFRVERIDTGRLIDQMERQARLIGGDIFGYMVHLAQRGRDGNREGAIQLLAELDKLPGRRDPDAPREVTQEGVWHTFVGQLRGLLYWSRAGSYLPDLEEGARLAQELGSSQSAAVPSSPALGLPTTGTNEDADAPNPTKQDCGAAPGTADPPVYLGLPLLPAHAPRGFNVFTGEPLPDGRPTEYQEHACALLGVDELDESPLPTITVHNDDDPIRRNVGDLTDRQDQELAAKLKIEPTDWDNLNEEQRIGRMKVAYLSETKTAGYRPGTELSKILRELNDPPSDSPVRPSTVEVMPNPFDRARRPWLPIVKECIGKVPELAGDLTEEKLRQWLWRKHKVPPTADLDAQQLVELFERAAAPSGPPPTAEEVPANRPPKPAAAAPPLPMFDEWGLGTDGAKWYVFQRGKAGWLYRKRLNVNAGRQSRLLRLLLDGKGRLTIDQAVKALRGREGMRTGQVKAGVEQDFSRIRSLVLEAIGYVHEGPVATRPDPCEYYSSAYTAKLSLGHAQTTDDDGADAKERLRFVPVTDPTHDQ
jgi:hypothetical protein